ncbi:hypothetical protein C2G38_2195044 [Gigaspora rosea]|uniref:Uncharacterized protein n=1 Tax=Gigaspora rosea TaxID=44941 RepID=A0A397UW70_9GLOM|nr:hypothetical protein C2G38_2195044 [Gigaspora rosea]
MAASWLGSLIYCDLQNNLFLIKFVDCCTPLQSHDCSPIVRLYKTILGNHIVLEKNDDGVELKICPIEVENENVTMVHFSRNKMKFDLTDFAEVTKMLVESSKKTAAGQAISRNYGASHCHSFFDPYQLGYYFRTLYLDNNPKFELRIEKLLANFVKQGYLDKQKSGFADSSSQAPEKDHVEYR